MQIIHDRKAFWQCWLDTPLNAPEDPLRRRALAPGTCVQSVALCGRVHKNGPDEWIVIGHGWEDTDAEMFVWSGNQYEFAAVWRID